MLERDPSSKGIVFSQFVNMLDIIVSTSIIVFLKISKITFESAIRFFIFYAFYYQLLGISSTKMWYKSSQANWGDVCYSS
jgi:hypothetical protein